MGSNPTGPTIPSTHLKHNNEKNRSDHVSRNRVAWNRWAPEFVESGRKAWQEKEPKWGIWNIPESKLRLLPEIVDKDVIELGCGTAYVSAWLTRLGARVTAIDNSEEQLKTAHELQREFGLSFKLVQGDAERVHLPDASFDLAISEYGASIWCDPYRWTAEASRLLRPGGLLIFLVNGTILFLCMPDEDDVPASPHLLRDYFGTHRFKLPNSGGTIEFHLGFGDWIRLLRRNGFEVEDLIQPQPPRGAATRWTYVKEDWARRWPSEDIWVARKRA